MSKLDIIVAPGVVAHPQIMSGTPCIQGRRLPTSMIAGMFAGGMSVQDIASDYNETSAFIEQAIRYEYIRRRNRGPEMRAITRGGKAVLVTDRAAMQIWKSAEIGNQRAERDGI